MTTSTSAARPDPSTVELLGRWVVVCDPAQRYVAVTDDLAAMLGYKRRDLIGRSSWETTTRPESERPAIVEQLVRNGTVSGVSEWLTRDGRGVDTAYTAQVVNGGEMYVVHATPLSGEHRVGVTSTAAQQRRAAIVRANELEAVAWLTKEEAAEYARCSPATVERAVHDKKLRAGGTGGLRLFRREWLDAWLGLVVVVLAVLALLCVAVCAVEPVGDWLPWCPCGPGLTSFRERPSAAHRERDRDQRADEQQQYDPAVGRV